MNMMFISLPGAKCVRTMGYKSHKMLIVIIRLVLFPNHNLIKSMNCIHSFFEKYLFWLSPEVSTRDPRVVTE